MSRKVIVYCLLAVVGLIVFEEFLVIAYIPRQLFRISLMLLLPLISIYFIKESNLKTEIQFDKPTLKELRLPLIIGIIIFAGTFGGYYMLRFMFEAEGVIEGAKELGITRSTVLIWGVYLSFVNSLLEEFFFRGYFYNALEKKGTVVAIIVSSLVWSIYHVVLFITLFDPWTVLFTLVGLFIIGSLLAYLNKFGKSFINSWIVHIFADIGCVVVLLYMFYIAS